MMNKNKYSYEIKRVFCFALFFCFTLSACTNQETGEYQDILTSLMGSQKDIISLIYSFSYVSGLFFFYKAVYQFKQFGANLTMMSSQNSMKGPLTSLMVGTALLFLPTMIKAFMITMFNQSAPTAILGYTTQSGLRTDFTKSVFLLVQIFGYASFLRGWFQISKVGSGNASPQITFSKAITHIVAGMVAINIQGVYNIIYNA